MCKKWVKGWSVVQFWDTNADLWKRKSKQAKNVLTSPLPTTKLENKLLNISYYYVLGAI